MESCQSLKKGREKVHFTSPKGYNLNFSINFRYAATQFLTDIPTWVCLRAKTVQKFKLWPVRQVKCTVYRICFLDFKHL